MIEEQSAVERDREIIQRAQGAGAVAKILAYTRLSGPGWLQGAITLGGGSLAGSLFLGVLAGYHLMWLQPLAMILGIIMLSAIGYVSLSTGERPFVAINKHINPVLGWGWAIATLMANLVWCMPQFALGTAAIRQNLAPGLFGMEAIPDDTIAKAFVVLILFTVATIVVWFYDSGSWGIKLFEVLLKLMVGVVVICFFGVVVAMTAKGDVLDWGEILKGFIPNPKMLTDPSPAFAEVLASTGQFSDFWTNQIVSRQQQVMITAAATAVGINMTFLLPYSMMSRGWDRDFRGLAMFDLSIGLFVPFVLATSCVVIASASQFHAKPAAGFLGETDDSGKAITPAENLVGDFNKLLNGRLDKEKGEGWTKSASPEEIAEARSQLPEADRRLAAMLVERNAFNLADTLAPLTGKGIAQYVFGIGVLGMALSTIIILMLINGFVVCEMLGLESRGAPHRAGCMLAAVVGAAGPFLWSGDARFWLAVPTSMFGMVLLPIAYFTFYLMMNSDSLLGANRPQGGKRIWWNVLMGIAAVMALVGSIASINASPLKKYGLIGVGAFILLALIVQVVRRKPDVESK